MSTTSPTAPLSEYDDRLTKVAALRAAGMDPYPARSDRTHTVADALAAFDTLAASGTTVTLAGRIRSKRVHGNLSFADLEDGTGRIQAALAKGDLGETYKPFVRLVDGGDFLEVTGTLFVTSTGAHTVKATSWRILTKALQSPPADHFGIADEETRYRKRYLDLLLDHDLRDRFRRRAAFWAVMRRFLTDRGFLEVETPTLEVTTGGAEARPFVTRHNDYDMDVFLRISVGELWQKRLLAAGFDKTFEIGRAYRNEGTSPNHLQEFTNMELYWAYADYNDGMTLVQDLYRTLAREVYGTTVFTAHSHTFDLAADWPRLDYVTTIREKTGIDVLTADAAAIAARLAELGVTHDAHTRERLIDNLWKHCRKSVAGPAFLTGHPADLAPLSKRATANPAQVEKFQVLLAGAEVGNGYSELNDPEDQRARFAAQQRLLAAGDNEAMMPDWEFVEMLSYGMPPACGFGVGERLFAFLEGVSLRDATLFPLMKPRS